MRRFPSNRVRIAVVLALALLAATLLFVYRQNHQRIFLIASLYLVTAAGTVALLFWVFWPRRSRQFRIFGAILAFAYLSVRWWVKGDHFWSLVACLSVAMGIAQYFRERRRLSLFKDCRSWPLAQGKWGQHYISNDSRVICYEYDVNGTYYSGIHNAGSMLAVGLKSSLDDLRDKPLLVRYKREEPELSTVLKSDQLQP